MLYQNGKPVLFMGNNSIKYTALRSRYSGSVHIANTCLIMDNAANQSSTRADLPQRIFDLLNYNGLNSLGGTPAAGGFEIEATFESDKLGSGFQTICGCRVGTSGKVTRANVLIGSTAQQISIGLSNDPSTNPAYGDSLIGKKVHIRFICVPVTDQNYDHAYSGRIIVEDADTGITLTDETQVFGDNFGYGNNAMFSTYTNFWCEPLTWFYRASSYNPNNIGYGDYGFEGYFWGGAIYINPTGADVNIPTRTIVVRLTPNKEGHNGATVDGVFYEAQNLSQLDLGVYELGISGQMVVCSQFVPYSEIKYID